MDCALKPNLSPEEDFTLRSLFSLMVNRLRFRSFRIAIRLIVRLNSQQTFGVITPGGSHFPYFDNLALAGTRVYDLYKRSASSSAKEVDEIAASVSARFATAFQELVVEALDGQRVRRSVMQLDF